MLQHSVRTSDGGFLRVFSYGTGPGVVFVGGTNTPAFVYTRAAKKLSQTVPVHVYDRRGRPGSSRQPEDYSMATEIRDLQSVLDATGSRKVFGHSYGGAIALEAGLQLPVSLIAVYDAAPNIDGNVPTAFLPELEEAVQHGDTLRAVTVLGKGITTKLRETRIPDPGFHALVWCMSVFTRKGRAWRGTVESAAKEIAWVSANQPAAEHYAGITVPVLVLFGARSDTFYRIVAESVADVLPNGRSQEIPGADHGALDRAPEALISPLTDFFNDP